VNRFTYFPLHLLPLVMFVGASSAESFAEAGAGPTPTPVVVRVVAHHAMALGDNVGGAQVTVRNVETGEVLASGRQTGASGDTKVIMQTPHLQVDPVYSVRDSASFKAELSLSKPTWVEVIGEGPLQFPNAKRRASKTVLLYPGKPVTGDGIILELDGLLVSIEYPTAERPLGIGDEGTVRATVKMLCGCIVEPFGNWDSRKMDLYGELRLGDKVIQKIDLYHQGPKGLFTGNFKIPRSLKGEQAISLRVVAADAEGVDVGFDEMTYPLVPWEQSRDATGREIPPSLAPAPKSP
jgi:hypothetical protein